MRNVRPCKYSRSWLIIYYLNINFVLDKAIAHTVLTGTNKNMEKKIDKGGKCGELLTDLSKAFDCLLHDLLIAKLHAYGFEFIKANL